MGTISKVAQDKINELVYDSWDRAYEELGTALKHVHLEPIELYTHKVLDIGYKKALLDVLAATHVDNQLK